MDVSSITISENNTMLEAMQMLDKVAKKVLFVVRKDKLIAAITDGDIRRWILKKGNLDAKVKDIANYNPKFLFEKDKKNAKAYMKQISVEALPIVDENMRIKSIVLWNDDIVDSHKGLNVPVVLMAGGLGTRLYPYTKILPKPLIPIGDIPISEHIINRFCQYGCNKFFMIVNHKKNMIKSYFNEVDKQYEIIYIDEEKPLGTGGGLCLLKGKINQTFILSNCDVIIEEDFEKIYQYHKQQCNLVTMICSLKNFQIPYGVIEIDKTGSIDTMKEKPEISFFVNTGIYFVEPKVIEELECKNAGFPDIIEKYRERGEKIGIYPISENAWLDMGQLDEMEIMIKKLNCKGS